MRPAAVTSDQGVYTRSSHLSNKTVNVVELGTAGNIKIKHAWVFHDDIFILLSHEKLLYMSVEVCIVTHSRFTSTSFIFMLQGVYYCVHDTVSDHGWEVSAVSVHLHTLCLGTACGQVRLYQLSDPVDLLRLDLAQATDTLRVGEGPVSCVTMSVRQERKNSNTRGHMVMVTIGGPGEITVTSWASAFTRQMAIKGGASEERWALYCVTNGDNLCDDSPGSLTRSGRILTRFTTLNLNPE